MDKHALVCRNILEHPQITQRELAQAMEVSLGSINRMIKECTEQDLITDRPRKGAFRTVPGRWSRYHRGGLWFPVRTSDF